MRTCRYVAFVVMGVAMMSAASPVFAQSNDDGVGFGLEVGITRATLKAKGAEDFLSSRTGVMGGIWFGGNRNGTLGLMGEITYIVKGANNDLIDSELKLHYLEIPALVRVNLGQTSTKWGVLIYPLVGPVVDIQLKADEDGLDVKNKFNGFDAGIIGGVGVEIARIGVEVRGNWGLKRLEKTSEGTFGGLTDIKSRTIQVLLKLRLN